MRHKGKRQHRLSVGLFDDEWEILNAAMKVEHTFLHDLDEEDPRDLNKRRCRVLRLCLWAVCNAIIKQDMQYPWACDLRDETKEEFEDRIAGKVPASKHQKAKDAYDAYLKEEQASEAWKMPHNRN